MKNKLLFIGLNGLAGSGKDTVAKMLKSILVKDWDNIQKAKDYYRLYFDSPNISATFQNNNFEKYQVFCIAFADQLKNICSSIFGIPVERFYNNKSNAWICINKDFHYTEIRPDNIITCEEYYYNCAEYKNSDTRYYLSLRDILVYIGTYMLQQDLNKNVFVNIVENTIKEKSLSNALLKYVIVTDIRFTHEMDYIREHHGVTIKIVKPGLEALNNIAEHDLDDEYDYNFNFTIENDGTYDDLFQKVWDLVHEEDVFKNEIVQLATRDDVDNYLRSIGDDWWDVCSPFGINRINHKNGDISLIDLVGGPTIEVGEIIPGTDLYVEDIGWDEQHNKFIVHAYKKGND